MPGERIVISDVVPQVDCGRWPAKACVGDRVSIAATIVRDGHEPLRAVVRHRKGRARWREEPLRFLGSDRYAGSFPVDAVGRWQFEVEAWVDRHAAWLDEHDRKVAAGQSDLAGELAEGEALFGPGSVEEWREAADALAAGDRKGASHSAPLPVEVERERARAGAWYELFPRSWGGLRGVVDAVPALAEHGFDVLYFPPIHPIGVTNRKGRNNTESATPGDVGSPWAIGAAEGGHDAIDPALGDDGDLAALVEALRAHGMELALDLALQTSPNHPWLREHPEWFQHRPDGSLKYAENPPKRYQDIHNFDWDTKERKALWEAIRAVVLRWCEAGVTVFRVDNPHTKPVPLWEWLIAEVRKKRPETVFLSEAFTRPAMMTLLAKAGFSQSDTYFTWRRHKQELTEYFTELSHPPVSEFFRPNVWPNTPDILHETLQTGGRPMFEARYVMAATLAATYGIYGPAFELLEHVPREPGSEEYLNSEKYEIRAWDLERPDSLAPLIRKVNAIRGEHPALQTNERLVFHDIDDDAMLAYTKRSADGSDIVLTIVSLDPRARRAGTLRLHHGALDLDAGHGVQVTDLLEGGTERWGSEHPRIELVPGARQVRILQLAPAR